MKNNSQIMNKMIQNIIQRIIQLIIFLKIKNKNKTKNHLKNILIQKTSYLFQINIKINQVLDETLKNK